MFLDRAKFATLWLILFGLLSLPALAQDESDDEKKEENKLEVEMVVSASRKAEKKLEAPSTIETVDENKLMNSGATTFSAAAAQIKGVDYQAGGITLQRVNARGFTTSYQSRMLTTKNGKLETLPGASIPMGNLAPTNRLDIKSIEVVLGPASALYGPNASSGVFNVITKTPWDEKGTTVLAKMGEQSLFESQLRHAGVSSDGKWGWKVNAAFLDAEDFDNDNVYFADGSNQTTNGPEATAAALAAGTAWREKDLASFDLHSEKIEVTGYYESGDYRFSASYGWTETDGFGTTNLGRNRLEDWQVETTSLELNHPRFFVHVTETANEAGGTFGIQNVASALGAGVPIDVSTTNPLIALVFDDSTLLDVEAQANQTWGNFELIGGINYREYKPDSAGTFLNDGGEFPWHTPIVREEEGAYIQFDYRILDQKLRFSGAYRYDDSNEFDAQNSPKFAVTYTEGNHNYRIGYNKAFRSPTILENNLHFARQPALGNINVALGNPVGWNVIDAASGTVIAQFEGLTPEEVETIEVGYRGVFGGNFVVDAVYYDSSYENFISALQTIAFIGAGTVATRADGNYPNWPFVLTYLNYGEAEVSGYDIGFDYYLTDWTISASFGHIELDSFTNDTAIPDLPFNSPEDKLKGSISYTGLENAFFGINYRSVLDDYAYVSGRWAGTIQSTSIADFAAGYTIPDAETTIRVSIQNLFDEDNTELLGVPAVPRFFTVDVTKKW